MHNQHQVPEVGRKTAVTTPSTSTNNGQEGQGSPFLERIKEAQKNKYKTLPKPAKNTVGNASGVAINQPKKKATSTVTSGALEEEYDPTKVKPITTLNHNIGQSVEDDIIPEYEPTPILYLFLIECQKCCTLQLQQQIQWSLFFKLIR